MLFLLLSLSALADFPTSLDDSDMDAAWAGEDPYDYAGRTVSGGLDVDGDGLPDVLVGAYGSDDGGAIGGGESYLILGSSTRASGSTTLSSADASWHGTTSYEYTSLELALVPDLDGDGYDEVAIATYKNSEVADESGKLYLLYGGGSWSTNESLADADAAWLGEDEYDHAGRAVAGPGDVDGDGYGDLLVSGCWNSDAAYRAGKTYLILGGPSRWSGDASLSGADASFAGHAAEEYSGRAIAGAGDVDGDGLMDLLVGAYGDDDAGTDAGETYLVLGRSRGWGEEDLEEDADGSWEGESASDRSGLVVAAGGDVDADGYDDVLVCAYRDDDGGTDAGAAYLVLGASGGWAMDTDLSGADAKYTGEDAGDYAGRSAAGVGDLDGDGYDDLAIGATGADDGASNGGAVYVVLGSASPADASLSSAETRIDGTDAGAEFGYVLGFVGDLDGGGLPDLFTAAYKDSSTGDVEAGMVRVLYVEPWQDLDGDGQCEEDGDCDETDASVYTGAAEVACDGIDQDCDGADLTDADADGFEGCGGPDCNDDDPAVHPGAIEFCSNGVDDDCDGLVDREDDCQECLDEDMDPDQDEDGWIREECGGEDCDDLDPDAWPGAPEVACDGADQDCDGDDATDVDADGWDSERCDGGEDCDDTDPEVHPGAEETPYDGVDDDCDGEDLVDVDEDGSAAAEAGGPDCDDTDAEVGPHATEDCANGRDDDCDGAVDMDDLDCGGVDTGDPCEEPLDSGQGVSGPGCGCAHPSPLGGLSFLLTLALVGLRRRSPPIP